jgi:hypothetical protein
MRGKYQGVPCPKCGKKGLRVPEHPHAFGYKNYGKVSCFYCNARFKEKAKEGKK